MAAKYKKSSHKSSKKERIQNYGASGSLDVEKIEMLKNFKENLKRKIAEAKMWDSLLKLENLVVNGQTVFCETDVLNGFTLQT